MTVLLQVIYKTLMAKPICGTKLRQISNKKNSFILLWPIHPNTHHTTVALDIIYSN